METAKLKMCLATNGFRDFAGVMVHPVKTTGKQCGMFQTGLCRYYLRRGQFSMFREARRGSCGGSGGGDRDGPEGSKV